MPRTRIARFTAAIVAGTALVAGAALVGAAAPDSTRPPVADSSWGGVVAPDPGPTPTVVASAMTVNDSSWGG
ncbi:hypothetical protein ACGF07_25365 [Kitasatospora sp. NPDC048194]|uniref:hypothetical protein n=1 Tax=Kitasatospora sp. NPDC048194 TaxID=3364045 RepID=UPI003721D127